MSENITFLDINRQTKENKLCFILDGSGAGGRLTDGRLECVVSRVVPRLPARYTVAQRGESQAEVVRSVGLDELLLARCPRALRHESSRSAWPRSPKPWAAPATPTT